MSDGCFDFSDARDIDRADTWSDAMTARPAPPARLLTIDLDQVPAAIAESIRTVLAQRNLLEAIEAADPVGFRSLFGELGNNAAQSVAFCEPYDDSEAA